MVRREDDNRVFVVAPSLEGFQETANVGIDRGDGGVVIMLLILNDLWCPRPEGRPFITPEDGAIIVRMRWRGGRRELERPGMIS